MSLASNRLVQRLTGLRAEGRRGLAPYVTAGDGGLERTRLVLEALDAAGATCVELGIPFSDPIADGPVLQAAAQRSLDAGTTLDSVVAMVRDLRAGGCELPLLCFSYFNPLYSRGLERACAELAAAGLDGVLVPDLPVEEAGTLVDAARREELCTIQFVAPTSTPERRRTAIASSSGFVYAIGRLGVTGARTELSPAALEYLQEVQAASDLPVAVGFGIVGADQVRAVTEHCDLAIVGSAIVKQLHSTAPGSGPDQDRLAARAAADLYAELATGLTRT